MKSKKIIFILIITFLILVQSVFAKNYIYDELNRLITVEQNNGDKVNYIYDSNGNIKKVETIYKDGSVETLPSSVKDLTEIIFRIDNPEMVVNKQSKEIDPGRGTKPIIVSDRTLLPVRAMIQSLGGLVKWDGNEQKVEIDLETKKIELWIGKKTASVNGSETELDVEPKIINERTMIPLRFVAENLDCDVRWDGQTREIRILR